MTRKRAILLLGRRLHRVGLALLAGLAILPMSAGRAADDPEPGGKFPKTTRADRTRSANNLKMIGLSFHNFNDTFGGIPAHAICDKAGKPLLSWRVAILPFIEEDKLFKEFKMDEPWDSKHNKKLLARMPKIYAPTISGKPAKADHTYYRVFTGPDTPFNPKVIRGFGVATTSGRIPATFTDGTSYSILVVEAGEAVPWTKPDELVYDAKAKKLPKLGGLFPEGFHVGMADGSVRFISRKIDARVLRALITPAGGEKIDLEKVPTAKPPSK
jgi:hypothetical protein